MKKTIKLNEQQLMSVITESVNRILNEGAYGYPDGIDGVILFAENDRECYDVYSAIAHMLVKHHKRGEEITVERLVNSSAMKKYQQLAFRRYMAEMSDVEDRNINPNPFEFRKYMSERMIDEVLDGQYD